LDTSITKKTSQNTLLIKFYSILATMDCDDHKVTPIANVFAPIVYCKRLNRSGRLSGHFILICPLIHRSRHLSNFHTALQDLQVNGCDGFSDGICEMLHQVGAGQNEEAAEGASLVKLSAKGCKNLTAFWLGVAPLDQPSAKQPVDYPELGQAVLEFQPWQPRWLPSPLPGLNRTPGLDIRLAWVGVTYPGCHGVLAWAECLSPKEY
jgi:hypothetical protein